MCCPLVFEFSVGIGGFVIGLGQISFFFSLCTVIQDLLLNFKYFALRPFQDQLFVK